MGLDFVLADIGTLLTNSVWVEIEDYSSGIQNDALIKIFAPFFTTKDGGKGSGLGLHIAQSIIENHQGEIRVTSEACQGATFRIELPTHFELNKKSANS